MTLLKDWNKFERTLLYTRVILVTVVGVITRAELLTTSCSLVGIITGLLLAKGKNLGQLFGLLISILYSILSFKNRFYGEVIIYSFLMLPMYIMGIISWCRHHNKETNTVEVNKIDGKEWILVTVVSVFATIGIYVLLKSFNTNELIVSTISVLTSLCALYFQVRRSRASFYFYILNDVVLMLLWGIPVIFEKNLLILPIFFEPVFNLINDIYGVYNWIKLEKKQKNLLPTTM